MRRLQDFYESPEKLGDGAYGTVTRWRLRSSPSASPRAAVYYAVKQIRWQSICQGRQQRLEQEEAIRQELKTLVSLDHPNIAMIREWFEDANLGIFFVMDLCEGGSMQDVLEQICSEGSLPRRLEHAHRLQRYFRDLLYAVSYVHSRGVVHRDLKPENVMLTASHEGEEDGVKLIDFGLAVLAEGEGDGSNWQKGTMVFMAPEMFLNASGSLNEKSDLWSMGVILAWIASAFSVGSLQHPMLPMEDGNGFDVEWYSLYVAFRDTTPWYEALFGAMPPCCARLAGELLLYEPQDRASASSCLDNAWVKGGETASIDLLNGAVENMRDFSRLDVFERSMLSLLASNIDDTQARELQKIFEALDTDRSGQISRTELAEGLERCGIHVSAQEFDALFDNEDGSGMLNYHDFLSAAMGKRMVASEQAIARVFHSLDNSGTGKLGKEAFLPLLGEEEADRVSKKYSRRQSRSLDSEEFFEAIKGISRRRQSVRPSAVGA